MIIKLKNSSLNDNKVVKIFSKVTWEDEDQYKISKKSFGSILKSRREET